MSTLKKGDVVADRFVIEAVAGTGGMGIVYRAFDQHTGASAALKTLHATLSEPGAEARFRREARILAELRHPGIVRYVTHGVAEGGRAYLAMEWLPGEDLRARLSRGRLGLAEARILLKKAAAALASAHERGVVHRDLKPSNLFLRGGDVEQTTLLDFGIARYDTPSQALTKSGIILGTPEYMAPEQARGEEAPSPAVDIFSLGAILFECLAGEPPFRAGHVAAVLARILFETPKRLREIRNDVPDEIDALVARMLAKHPGARYADAKTLLAAVSELPEVHGEAPAQLAHAAPPSALADSDQRLVSVLVAASARPPREAETQGAGDVEMEHARLLSLQRDLSAYGAQVELVVGGMLVATFPSSQGAATDLAAQAARAALLVRARWPVAGVALATGRAAVTGEFPVGDALDCVNGLLRDSTEGEVAAEEGRVLLDEVTAGLLDTRFRTRKTQRGAFVLEGVELDVDTTRLLLGKPTPCVGRETELLVLESAVAACIEELVLRAILVIGPPGIGKSRLRRELVRRVTLRPEPVQVLIGRGDPLMPSSSHGLLGRAISRLCGVQEGDPLEVRRDKLRRRLAARVQKDEAARVTEFLGWLCGAPLPDAESPMLQAARHDPHLMNEQVEEAWLDFLRAECAAQPVLLILDDLHWSDALTLRLVHAAQRRLKDLPLIVLALARPEIDDTHPNLWRPLVQRVSLLPLSRRASERIVRHALPSDAAPEVVGRIVEQAAGNALFLEELVQANAEGYGQKTPETVVAMLQARISRLDSGARRVLRAASLFGATFWLGGVRALAGGGVHVDDAEEHLATLAAAGLVESCRGSHLPGDREYRFQHALMRDAAYELLTEEERRRGHGLCLDYLELSGESDVLVLCEHAVRCGDRGRALSYLIRAAQTALDHCDLDAAERLAKQGLQTGAEGEARGALLAALMGVLTTQQRWAEGTAIGFEATALLPVGSTRWYYVATQLLATGRVHGLSHLHLELLPQLATIPREAEAAYSYAMAVCVATSLYIYRGLRAPARQLVSACAAFVGPLAEPQVAANAHLLHARSLLASRLEPAPFEAIRDAEDALAGMRRCGNRMQELLIANHLGGLLFHVGRGAEGEELLLRTREDAQRRNLTLCRSIATTQLIMGYAQRASAEDATRAVELARTVMDDPDSPKALAHGVLPSVALALAELGQAAEAEQTAREAVAALKDARTSCVDARAALSRILLLRGQAAEARREAEEGFRLITSMGGCGVFELPLRLSLVEALAEGGDMTAAEDALRGALAELTLRAGGAPDDRARELYLTGVPVHARLLALARSWLGVDVV